MIIDGPPQVSSTRRTRDVSSYVNGGFLADRRWSEGKAGISTRSRRFGGLFLLLDVGRICARLKGRYASKREANALEGNPMLKHTGDML